MIINKKTLGFIITSLILCVKLASSQISVFSNTTVKACGDDFGTSWGTTFSRTVTTSGLPVGGLSTTGTVLREVRVRLGNSGCKGNLSSYSLSIVNPQGVRVILANQLMTTSTGSWVDMKFRDDIALERIKEYSNTVQYQYVPHSIGYYAIETDGQFANFNTGADPNGNWQFQVIETTSSVVSFEKVELVFGPPICVTDYIGDTGNNFCSGASCIANGVFRATNNGYSVGDPQYPLNTVGSCSWNGNNNNSAWFRFVPTSTTARITLSGILNSSSPGSNDTQPIIVKGNGSCLTPTRVPTGGCPDDESINNSAYLSTNGGGITTSGNVYSSGISENCEFNLSGLTIGDPYYLYVDGNGGVSSSFYIEVESGVNNCCPNSGCNNTSISVSQTNPTCGSANGSATVTPNPAGSTYTWSAPAVVSNTNNIATGLPAGTYTININQGSCANTTTVITLISAGSPSITSVQTTPADCGSSNGTATVSTNPASGVTFTWNPSVSTTSVATGLASGNYTVVAGVSGCTVSNVVTISNSNGPNAVTSTTTQASCGLSNGTVSFSNVTGGTAPYQYNFNNQGFSSNTSYTIGAGSYPVVVSDAGNCTFTTNVTIGSGSGPNAVSSTTTQATCGLNNGTVSFSNVTGGTAPYQYNFNNQGFSSNTSYTIGAGSYPVVVSDAGNCTFTTNVTIDSGTGPNAVTSTTTQASCGLNNGTVSFSNVTGGTAPYQYNFNNQGFSSNTSYTIGAGSYPVVVSDAGNCTFTTNITIVNSNGPSSIEYTTTSATCGIANGIINFTNTIGGTPPYLYNFNTLGFSSNTTYTSTAGSYPIIVQDAGGCTYSTSVTISNISITFTPVIETQAPGCNSINGSLAILNVLGGTAPYTYKFNDGIWSSISVFNNLNSGFFPLEISDANSCVSSFTVSIDKSENAPLIFAPNSFSPNKDQINDTWYVLGYCISEFECYIFNRWGEEIIKLNDIDEGWTASEDETKITDDVYTYKIKAVGYNKEVIYKTGHIYILR